MRRLPALTVSEERGVRTLPECCDLLVVDAFAGEHPPAELVSQAFFDAGALIIVPEGGGA